jgi:hypothetical protein
MRRDGKVAGPGYQLARTTVIVTETEEISGRWTWKPDAKAATGGRYESYVRPA